MTHKLQELLGNDHPLFIRNINDLEQATGHAGVDTRLIADITETAHDIMRQLRLDPADTTGPELYKRLENTVLSGEAESLLVGTAYTLLDLGDGPVSFNLQDVIDNFHHELLYEDRAVAHAQRHLRLEIVKRYVDHERTDKKAVIAQAKEIGIHQSTDQQYPLLESSYEQTAPASDAPRILAIGDIFTDAFIKLSEDVAHVEEKDGKKWLNIPFGGRPPYEEVEIVQSVGPSPNSAVSFARLGLQSSLMSWLGSDKAALDSLAHLKSEHVGTELVAEKPDAKSNYYYVLRLGAERTILTKDETYDYVWREPAEVPDWIYLASISDDSWQLHLDLLAYLEQHPETKLAFQPGTFHFTWGKDKLAAMYKRAHIVLLNREEAVDVTGASYDSLSGLAKALHALGPDIAVITDGPNGSYASDGTTLYKMPNYPDPAPPYDRTGAGDAFASTVVAALALGQTLETALTWAPINSMSVVQKLGAQAGLLQLDEIKDYLKNAPEDYKAMEYKG